MGVDWVGVASTTAAGAGGVGLASTTAAGAGRVGEASAAGAWEKACSAFAARVDSLLAQFAGLDRTGLAAPVRAD